MNELIWSSVCVGYGEIIIFSPINWLTVIFHGWKTLEQHVKVYFSWAKFEWQTISNIAEKKL